VCGILRERERQTERMWVRVQGSERRWSGGSPTFARKHFFVVVVVGNDNEATAAIATECHSTLAGL
jgi:hypothetical protein